MDFHGGVILGQAGLGSGLSLASDWRLLTVPLWLPLISLLLVVIHEVGHLVAAYLVGGVPTELSIGAGDPRRTFSLGSLDLTIRKKPLAGGRVEFAVVQGAQHRWRMVTIFLAGLALETAFWIVVFLPGMSFDSVSVAHPVPSLATILSLWAVIVLVLHVVVNLTPHVSNGLPTDGMNLLMLASGQWRTVCWSRAAIADNQRIVRLTRASRYEDVLDLVERRLGQGRTSEGFDVPGVVDNDSAWLFTLGAYKSNALLQLGRYPESIRMSEQQCDLFGAMGVPEMDGMPEAREKAVASLGNSLAYGLALDGSQLERALALAVAAVEVDASEATLGTLGAILVQVGREGEGIDILNKTLHIAPTDLDKFETHRFLALGYRAEGDVEAAIGHCEQALALCPDFAERIEPILADLAADGRRSLPGALKG